MIESAGIIAAGEGSRLRAAGVQVPKPLVPIAGLPLIGHALENLEDAGVRRVVIIFQEMHFECAHWVQENFPMLDFEILHRTTRSSFESFWRIGRELGPGRHLISTVDCIGPASEWRKMIQAGAESHAEVLLGVTSFVQDENPLWVRTDRPGLRVAGLGGVSGEYATAGMYNVPDAIFQRDLDEKIPSLRIFLQQLLREQCPMSAVPLADVVDVDTLDDIEVAERFISGMRSRS